jgi:hypothetical protein
MDHAQGDGLDGGAGESSGVVAQDGPARPDVDGHAEQRVDQTDGIGGSII